MNRPTKIITRLKQLTAAAIIAVVALPILVQCATIGTPEGGPKDTLPPVVLGVYPKSYTTNFTDKKIEILFDEYIQLKDQQKELYTSPEMKKKPTLLMRGKTLHVEIKDDSLKPNTTYAIEFGATISDNNEGNPLHGYRYVFSTGAEIDSLVMSGYTEDSEKVDSLGRTFIYFFEADSLPEIVDYDSTMFNFKPHKIARSQKNGIFIAQNLRPVDYRIYAFYDNNDNQLYEPGEDKIGFLDRTYNPAEMEPFYVWYDSIRRYPSADPQLYFRLFVDESFSRQTLKEKLRPDQHKVELYFGAKHPDIRSIKFDGVRAEDIIYEPVSARGDTLYLWLRTPSAQLPDTLKGEIVYLKHDSIRQLQEEHEELKLHWRLIETKEQEKERERLERERRKAEENGTEWVEPPVPSKFKMTSYKQTAEVNPEEDLAVEFATPLTRFDSASIRLLSWSELGDTIRERFHFIPDTLSPRKFRMRSDWSPLRKYELFIPTDALADITGEGNDSLKMSLTVADKEKFAVVNLTVQPRKEEYRYVVQFVDSKSNKVVRTVKDLSSGTHTVNYVEPTDLKIRIIEDMNHNGRWDGGNMVEHRQSERSEFYKDANGEETFTAKTGWEFDITLDMATIFAPITMQDLIERLDKREMERLAEEEKKRQEQGNQNRGNNQSQSGGMLGGGGMFGGGGGMLGGGGMGGMMGGSSGSNRQNIGTMGR